MEETINNEKKITETKKITGKEKKVTGKEKKELNKFLSRARDNIIKYCDKVFSQEYLISSLTVCDQTVTGFVLISDIAYSQLLLNAFKKETLVTEKRNGNHRNILFDYDKHLMISADKHKLIVPGDSLKEKFQEFNAININNNITSDANNIPTECEVCGTVTKSCCSKCKVAFYCSHDHQKKDWPHHKNFCDGFGKPSHIPIVNPLKNLIPNK
jgi:hypothetical protein